MGTVQSKLHVLLRGIVNYQWYFDFYISVNTVNLSQYKDARGFEYQSAK